MKQPQSLKVVEQLEKTGEVSRNWALNNYISRLGVIIKSLVEVGYKFDSRKSKNGIEVLHGRYVKTKKGRDYVYTLIAFPHARKQKNTKTK